MEIRYLHFYISFILESTGIQQVSLDLTKTLFHIWVVLLPSNHRHSEEMTVSSHNYAGVEIHQICLIHYFLNENA